MAILLEGFDVLVGDASTKSLNMKLIVVCNVSVWSAASHIFLSTKNLLSNCSWLVRKDVDAVFIWLNNFNITA